MIELEALLALKVGDQLILGDDLSEWHRESGHRPGDIVRVIETAHYAASGDCLRCVGGVHTALRWFRRDRFERVANQDWYDIWLPTGS
jgi:hypothetical protein